MGTLVPIFNMTKFEQIESMVVQLLEGSDCYLVEAKVTPKNNFKFAIDSDTGFGIGDSAKITRKLRNQIEEAEFFPDGDFTLELGSPGLDKPLKQHRQFVKNVGRLVLIEFNNEETKALEGRLKVVTEENITIEITDKKKKTSTEHIIALADAKSVTVQIEF
jgi:ribosome maturation factor RimP